MLDIPLVVAELAEYLIAQGICDRKGIKQLSLPASPPQMIAILAPGGAQQRGDPMRRPNIQILVRDKADQLLPAVLRANRIYNLLDHKVPPLATVQTRIVPEHVPGPWYRDVNQNVVATLNFGLIVQPTA